MSICILKMVTLEQTIRLRFPTFCFSRWQKSYTQDTKFLKSVYKNNKGKNKMKLTAIGIIIKSV